MHLPARVLRRLQRRTVPTQRLALPAPAGLRARPVELWYPEDWDAHRGAGRTLLVMHDGQNLFHPGDSFAGETWGVVEALERLRSIGAIAPTAVVGVWNDSIHRWREYVPMVEEPDSPRWLQFAVASPLTAGGPLSDRYTDFLHDQVIPAAHRALAVGHDETIRTVIAGSSMGGLMSLELLTRFPERYDAAACLSTHWTAIGGACVDYFIPRLPEPGRHRLYFDYGTRGLDAAYAPHQQRIDEACIAAGYRPGRDLWSLRFDGADHNERAWRQRVEVPLALLLTRD